MGDCTDPTIPTPPTSRTPPNSPTHPITLLSHLGRKYAIMGA